MKNGYWDKRGHEVVKRCYSGRSHCVVTTPQTDRTNTFVYLNERGKTREGKTPTGVSLVIYYHLEQQVERYSLCMRWKSHHFLSNFSASSHEWRLKRKDESFFWNLLIWILLRLSKNLIGNIETVQNQRGAENVSVKDRANRSTRWFPE